MCFNSEKYYIDKKDIEIPQMNRDSLIVLLEKKDQELKTAKQKLKKTLYKIKEEMDLAKQIQEGLMPKILSETVNLKSAVVYMPAEKVGGDLYDIIITKRQKIAVLIFDVSGHGVPAALIGSVAKMLFAHFIEKMESPSEIFYEVNKKICQFVKTEQYLTAFLGLIDPVKNCMVYSRAGHVPPMIYDSNSGQVIKLDSNGFFIGHSALISIAEYKDQIVSLNTGNKVLFYTDGLTEGCNTNGKLYGIKRLEEIFLRVGSDSPNKVLDSIINDQQIFRKGTPLRDDFTMLCIEIGNPDELLENSGFTREDEPGILIVNTINEIENSCAIILKEMDKNRYPDCSIRQIKLCVFEMITNAIIHGNKNDSSKKVVIFYKVTPVVTSISVMDEGGGFDYNKLPDPLLSENVTKNHGRGVFLVKSYFDEIEFNNKGNRITGRKYNKKQIDLAKR